MIEEQEMIAIEKRDLVETVVALRSKGYRLVQICATNLPDRYEINYSFDKDRRFRNLKITILPGETVPSVSLLYGNAFFYENEIHDLFGISVENIDVDYHGTLYQVRIPTPFGVKPSEPQDAVGGSGGGAPEAVPETRGEDRND